MLKAAADRSFMNLPEPRQVFFLSKQEICTNSSKFPFHDFLTRVANPFRFCYTYAV